MNIEKKQSKTWIAMVVLGVVAGAAGVIMMLAPVWLPKEALPDLAFPSLPTVKSSGVGIYSDLTGLALASEAEKSAPTFCVQMPNGLDGARPQAGMHQAGVVFEAIAERGITRFAAVYQNPTSAVIGPLRSLRLYYLQWDTPFDCTIVHAGGADDALAAVRAGGYKDLSENYTYMYRGMYANYDRLWNNLFTTGAYLRQFSADSGYSTSNIQGFARMTPDEAAKARIDAGVDERLVITKAATGNIATVKAAVTDIAINFGGWDAYDVTYKYDSSSNSYLRSFGDGTPHNVYDCPAEDLGEVIPESNCTLKQMSPSVVVAMMVEEHLADDGYHEDIAAVGSGVAYIFQNGQATEGSWSKASVNEQIRFFDAAGKEVALVPGQTFVEAVPRYGAVSY